MSVVLYQHERPLQQTRALPMGLSGDDSRDGGLYDRWLEYETEDDVTTNTHVRDSSACIRELTKYLPYILFLFFPPNGPLELSSLFSFSIRTW